MIFNKPKFWRSINIFSIILLPFSFLYFLLFSLKKNFANKQEFNIPIICVGNIFVGGTGKTPLSIYIHNFLKKKKFKPAIASKYYKSHFDEINLTKKRYEKKDNLYIRHFVSIFLLSEDLEEK